MDKPIMVGQAILDKSKELMYHFYYDYLKPKYKENVNLMYMDTDSFVLEIETCDFFEDIKDDLKNGLTPLVMIKTWYYLMNMQKLLVLTKKLLVR